MNGLTLAQMALVGAAGTIPVPAGRPRREDVDADSEDPSKTTRHFTEPTPGVPWERGLRFFRYAQARPADKGRLAAAQAKRDRRAARNLNLQKRTAGSTK